MGVLLDFTMPITANQPPPQGSTAHLKKLAVIVKGKDPAANQTVVCYNVDEIAAVTDNTSVLEVFKALNSITLVISPTLADAVVSDNDYYTLVISEDFEEAEAAAYKPTFSGVLASIATSNEVASKGASKHNSQRTSAEKALKAASESLIEALKNKDKLAIERFTKSRNKAQNDISNLPNRCVFLDAEYSAKGCIFAFSKLLSGSFWRGQQYIQSDDSYYSVSDLGEAESLFESRVSFYLNDSQYGTRLAFFAAGGNSITTPYILEQLKIELQSSALIYINQYQPKKTETTRINLEAELNDRLKDYMQTPTDYLDKKSKVKVFDIGERFILNASIDLIVASDLWRIKAEVMEVEQ